jgi:hypothetical protein
MNHTCKLLSFRDEFDKFNPGFSLIEVFESFNGDSFELETLPL